MARGELRDSPVVFATLPNTNGHAWRPLRLGPDEKLYAAIGADCNVCPPGGDREQSILRFDLERGEEEEIVASGFRNVAHFDWQPESGAMFATEVGADRLGDDAPLEELNEIEVGGFYGFPYLHGPRTRDPALAAEHEAEIANSLSPADTFTADSSPLGVTFLRSTHHPRTTAERHSLP